jgi:hypothetical protein
MRDYSKAKAIGLKTATPEEIDEIKNDLDKQGISWIHRRVLGTNGCIITGKGLNPKASYGDELEEHY